MKLRLLRDIQTPDAQFGRLQLREEPTASPELVELARATFSHPIFTLEPPIGREEHPAIQEGTFEVTIEHSPKFGEDMPHIKNVFGRIGILIHPGNEPHDTEGCILVGRMASYRHQAIYDSVKAFNALYALLFKAIAAGEKITLEVTHA